MGARLKNTVDIDGAALHEAIRQSSFAAADVSRIIGREKSYCASAVRYGACDSESLMRIASLLRVDVNDLLKKAAPAEQPAEQPAEKAEGKTDQGVYEQIIRIGARLDDIEKELRRLQEIAELQKKQADTLSAMLGSMVKWTDVFDHIKRKSVGAETALLRIVHLMEGKR